jgi:hypothetical protein
MYHVTESLFLHRCNLLVSEPTVLTNNGTAVPLGLHVSRLVQPVWGSTYPNGSPNNIHMPQWDGVWVRSAGPFRDSTVWRI